MHRGFDQGSSPRLIGGNFKVEGFDSRKQTRTDNYMHTHTLEIFTCCESAFSSSSSEALGGAAQPQSHLPPLSPSFIQHITSSLKPLFPWQPGAALALSLCVSLCLSHNRLFGLHEQHVDENLPKAQTSHAASTNLERAQTPQADLLDFCMLDRIALTWGRVLKCYQ